MSHLIDSFIFSLIIFYLFMYFSLAVSPSGVPCLDLEKGALFLSFYYSCRLIPHDKLLPALLALLQEVGSYRPLSGATAVNFGKRVGSSGSALDGFDWTAVEIMETTPPQPKIHTRLSSTSLPRPLAHTTDSLRQSKHVFQL